MTIVAEASLDSLGPLTEVETEGPGRLLLATDSGAVVFEARPGGPVLRWDGRGHTGQPPSASSGALVWLLEKLWDHGIGPGAVLVVGELAGVEAARPAGVVHVDAAGWSVVDVLASQVERRRAKRLPAVDEQPAWCIVCEGDRPERRRVDETLLTVADGRVGTRGSVEETGPASDPLVVAAGVYDARDPLVTLLPGPRWTGLEVDDPRSATQRRVLDLRTGVVARTCDTSHGPLRTIRFAAAARPGAVVLRGEAPVEVLRAGRPWQPPTSEAGYEAGSDGVGWARTRSTLGGGITGAAAQTESVDRGVRVVERLAASRSDTDSVPAAQDAIAEAGELVAVGFDQLLAEQRATWASRWADADIRVDGDAVVQLGVRFALFHLLASVAAEDEAALGARGLSGRAYAATGPDSGRPTASTSTSTAT